MKTFKEIMNEKKAVSAALILTNGEKILAGRATDIFDYQGRSKWDLPKGGIDPGESALEAVVRETFEETNLKINPNDLKDLGVFNYNKKKNLHIFLLKTNDLPDVKKMKCTSYFTNDYGEKTLEIDDHRYIKIDELDRYMFPNLVKVIKKILN